MFKPFATISRTNFLIMVALQLVFALAVWQLSPGGLIPGPLPIAKALGGLLTSSLLADNLLVSLLLTVKAMVYSVLITLIFSYLSVIPFSGP